MPTMPATASTNCVSLCTAAGDKASLAIGMAGLVMEHVVSGPDARGVAAGIRSTWPCIESIGDPTLTVGLSFAAIYAKIAEAARWPTCCGWSQTRHRPGRRRPRQRQLHFRVAVGVRVGAAGSARYCLGRPGLARRPATRPGHGPQRRPADLRCGRRWYVYGSAIPSGVLLADDAALREIEEALADCRAIR